MEVVGAERAWKTTEKCGVWNERTTYILLGPQLHPVSLARRGRWVSSLQSTDLQHFKGT